MLRLFLGYTEAQYLIIVCIIAIQDIMFTAWYKSLKRNKSNLLDRVYLEEFDCINAQWSLQIVPYIFSNNETCNLYIYIYI